LAGERSLKPWRSLSLGDDLELIGTHNVVFSRVAASGSGASATGAALGAGIGNLIRSSKDRHRPDMLDEEALPLLCPTYMSRFPHRNIAKYVAYDYALSTQSNYA
jgi:hypothetical protein